MRGIKYGFYTLILTFVFCNISQAQVLFGLVGDGPNSPSDLYTIDTNTGAANFVGPTGFERCGGMDFDVQTQTLFAACERNDGSDIGVLVSINRLTGQGTEIGPLGCNTATDISFRNADNVLFGALFGGNCPFGLRTIDLNTGAANFLGTFSLAGCCGNGMAFSLADLLFIADDVELDTLDQSNGSNLSSIALNYPDIGDTPRINAMDLNPNTDVMFASVVSGGPEYTTPRANFLATVNLLTGDVNVIGDTQEGLDAIAFAEDVGQARPIPALSEIGLIAAALILFASAILVLRRRQKAYIS